MAHYTAKAEEVFSKHPDEVLTFPGFEFDELLTKAGGTTLSGSPAVTVQSQRGDDDANPLTIADAAISGTLVVCTLSAGVSGVSYDLKASVVDSAGNTLVIVGTLEVDDGS